MKLKFLSIITLLALIFTYIPVGAAAPTVTIISPEANSTHSPYGVVLEAEVSGADKVLFMLNDEEVAEFEGDGILSFTPEDIEYATHTFKVIAIKRGENVKEAQVKFTTRDFSESEAINYNFNSFDGEVIGTSGFAGFNANAEKSDQIPNGVIGKGVGPDGSAAFKFMVGKVNATDLYLPFVNFNLPSTNKDIYVFEHDVLISDMGMRLKYETVPGVHRIIENGKVGSFELQPETWYKLRTEFDFQKNTYDIYVDGELRGGGSLSSITATQVRIQWANSQTADGYLLMDNFTVTRKISTPIVSSYEYHDGSQFVPFTTEVPEGTDTIRVYFDAAISAAGQTIRGYENGVEMKKYDIENKKWVSLVDIEINEAGGYADIFMESPVKSDSTYKFVGRAGDIETDMMFKFISPKKDISIMQLMFNAGSYQAKYQEQLTDGANVSTTVVVTNKTSETRPLMAIVCAYKDGEMTGIRAAQAIAPANGPAFMNVPALSVDSDTEIICHIVDGWEMRRPVMVAGQLLKH